MVMMKDPGSGGGATGEGCGDLDHPPDVVLHPAGLSGILAPRRLGGRPAMYTASWLRRSMSVGGFTGFR